ncbi:MAG: HvfA family oxazolone/thioamide-modified RiPP metallophore [Pseudoxanthomonas sp.]
MSKSNQKPVSLALCTALVGGLALSASAFAMQPLAQGYLLSATADAGEKAAEGKCGEGKCGMEKVDTDKDGKVSRAEFTAAHADKADKFDAIDTNKDGFIDAAEHKAHAAEGKCGEGKCGADKKTDAKPDAKAGHAEGKCGEGKCGGSL